MFTYLMITMTLVMMSVHPSFCQYSMTTRYVIVIAVTFNKQSRGVEILEEIVITERDLVVLTHRTDTNIHYNYCPEQV